MLEHELAYIEQNLNNYLENIDKNNRIKIEKNIKKFNYLLMNYTLKLISLISEKINDNHKDLENQENIKLKQNFMTSFDVNLAGL